MVRRHALRDDQSARIENLLPGREGTVGVTAKDNRLFVEAVLYRYRAGIPWRDLRFSRAFRAGRVGVTRHGERGRGGVRFQRDRTSSASASSGGCFVPRQDWSSMAA